MEMDNRGTKMNTFKNNKAYSDGILAIGPCVSNKHQVTGQSMMFQLIVDSLKERGHSIQIVDILGKSKNSQSRSGVFSWARVWDYLNIIPDSLKKMFEKNKILYITTAQSKYGFFRDVAIILPASIMKKTIIVHQFGANYKGFYDKQSSLIKFFIRYVLSKAFKIIVEGEYVKVQFSFLNNYKSKVVAVPNGLPERTTKYAKVHKNYNRHEPFRILYLSNLIESKGFWDVLEAVRILINERGKNIKCVFAGKFIISSDSKLFTDADTAKKEFFNIINKNNLQEHISYFEGLYNEEKSKVFMDSHIFILPSNYINEGQPVSILEAMAYGTPVIATDYRLIPSMVINNETGFFVKY